MLNAAHQDELKPQEILIPADGDCLYTSIFIGFLISVIHDEEEFAHRLLALTGDATEGEILRDFFFLWEGKIKELKSAFFKGYIAQFRKHMGLDDGRWGGPDEIKQLEERLNIKIQILTQAPSAHADRGYIAIDGDIGSQAHTHSILPAETLSILQTIATPEEAIQDADDPHTQIAKMASLATSTSEQHYRLISEHLQNLLNEAPVVEQNSLERPPQPLSNNKNFETNLVQMASTALIGGFISQGLKAMLDPALVSWPTSVEPNQETFMEGMKLMRGDNISSTLLGRATEFGDGKSINPAVKSSDYDTLIELMVRLGMQERPQYFDSISTEEKMSSENKFAVGANFLTEFVQGGSFDVWLARAREKITTTEKEPYAKQPALEFLNRIENFAKYVCSDAVNDPAQNPVNKYVDPVDIKNLQAYSKWLTENQNHPGYDRVSSAYNALELHVLELQNRALSEGAGYSFSLLKQLSPELAQVEEMDDMLPFLQAKWKKDERQHFEEYLRTQYTTPHFFEPNVLRAFSEELQGGQYGETYYEIVCESFNEQYTNSGVHLIAKQIWAISQLDTIHENPQEAKSRMPAASFDGKYAVNFGYKMDQSVAYQDWLQNPLPRACGDIIMDAFQFIVEIGCALDVPKFLERFALHLFGSMEERMAAREDSPHFYDKLMIAFELYLLETVFNTPFVSDGIKTITDELQKAAQTNENLIEVATSALQAFKEFSLNQLLPLRPSQEPLTKEDRFRGFVFGIGFNGTLFDSPSHSNSDEPEIWITFSDAGRIDGGYVFLSFVKEVAERHYGEISAHLIHSPGGLGFYFNKYKEIIHQHIAHLIDWHRGEPRSQSKFKKFMEELEGKLSFDDLTNEFKQWLQYTPNWYCIPSHIAVNVPEEMPEAEHEAQKFARKLLFDALAQRQFSVEYPELMPGLFLHWKQAIIAGLSASPEEIEVIEAAKELQQVPGEFLHKINEIINTFVWQVHPLLKAMWIPEIEKQFSKFMKSDAEAENAHKELRKSKSAFDNIEKALANAGEGSLSKLKVRHRESEEILMQKQQIVDCLPKNPAQLSLDRYMQFREEFFRERDVSQCIEPLFARVIGHDRFFSVYLSKKVAETKIKDKATYPPMPLQLGTRIPQDVIAPCDQRCQHHALGHLYTGDALTYQSIDRLDEFRRVHGLGEVVDRLMPLNKFPLAPLQSVNPEIVSSVKVGHNRYMVRRFNDSDLSTHNQQCSPNEDLACFNNSKASTIWKDEEILLSSASQQEKELSAMIPNEQFQDRISDDGIDKGELEYKLKEPDEGNPNYIPLNKHKFV